MESSVRTLGHPAAPQRKPAWQLACAVVLLLLAAGCSSTNYVEARGTAHNPLEEQLALWNSSGPEPTARTLQFLRRYNLSGDLKGDPQALLAKVQDVVRREPTPQGLYSLAELAYVGGVKLQKKKDPRRALDLYSVAVAQAYLFLMDPRFREGRNPFDPQFRSACELYNSALEAGLRLSKIQGSLRPGAHQKIELAGQTWDITVAVRGALWRDEDFGRVEFVSDYRVKGLQNQYHTYGLGVPLIVVRDTGPGRQDPAAPYYAPGLAFPITAFLRLLPDDAPADQGVAQASAASIDPISGQRLATDPSSLKPQASSLSTTSHHRAILELCDPLAATDLVVEGRRIPLETDLSTPLAYCLDDKAFQELDNPTLGLLRPDSDQAKTGLYMLEPYQPNKIPVLMIHGLWSSPLTWMEMFNDLYGSPELRANYQFWFFNYPTGQPFWQTAAELRRTLVELRQRLDPQRQAVALDQMVLVGHSMGGLVARLQSLESGDAFWRLVSGKSLAELKTDDAIRGHLAAEYYFDPSTSIRRVITIATPNRGSDASNETTQWLGRKLISLPQALVKAGEKLRLDNPGYFPSDSLVDVTDSIDALSPKSPILPVMLSAQRAPWITYHNIVGRLPSRDWLGRTAEDGDGIVPFTSAHLDDVASELAVPAAHVDVQRHPLSILEVRRILLEQADELRQNPYGPPRTLTATRASVSRR